jgi:probable F420-dependent oxidoreductase
MRGLMTDRLRFGVIVRNMGVSSMPGVLDACVRAVETAGFDDLWVVDHVAIPPDDAAGSNGRYLEILATLAYLAGTTERVALGAGVVVLPYRPALLTAKWVATIQELSRGRLLLGVGAGWMHAEFAALGVERRKRGALTDETLAFLHHCFDAADDVAEANGQRFLFRPRPQKPPIYVGGAPPHALRRAVRFGDGWFPLGLTPAQLRAPAVELQRLAAEAGRGRLEIVAGLAVGDAARARDDVAALRDIGVTRVVAAGGRYDTADEFRRWLEAYAAVRDAG